MNAREESFDVIYNTIVREQGEDEGLAAEVHRALMDWMNRNMVVFYQP